MSNYVCTVYMYVIITTRCYSCCRKRDLWSIFVAICPPVVKAIMGVGLE